MRIRELETLELKVNTTLNDITKTYNRPEGEAYFMYLKAYRKTARHHLDTDNPISIALTAGNKAIDLTRRYYKIYY